MFDDMQNPSPSTNNPGVKTEDIFAGVEKNIEPAPPANPPVNAPDPELESRAVDNKKYFIIGSIILGVALIILAGGYGYKYYVSLKAGENNKSLVENTQENQEPAAAAPTSTAGAVVDNIVAVATSTETAATTTNSGEIIATGTPTTTPETDPVDSDADGLKDTEETRLGTSINNSDSDSDGLFDYEEVKTYKTDPLKSDSDNDGYSDGSEVRNGYNPLGEGKLFDTTDPAKSIK